MKDAAVVAQDERLEDRQETGDERGRSPDRPSQDHEDQSDGERSAEGTDPAQLVDEIHPVAADPEQVDRDGLDDEEAGRVQEERPVGQVRQLPPRDRGPELGVEHLVDPQLEAGGQPDRAEAERGDDEEQGGQQDGAGPRREQGPGRTRRPTGAPSRSPARTCGGFRIGSSPRPPVQQSADKVGSQGEQAADRRADQPQHQEVRGEQQHDEQHGGDEHRARRRAERPGGAAPARRAAPAPASRSARRRPRRPPARSPRPAPSPRRARRRGAPWRRRGRCSVRRVIRRASSTVASTVTAP